MTSPDERPARQEVDMLKRTLANKRKKDPKPESGQSLQKPGKKKPSRMALPVFAFALLACGAAHADVCRVTTAGTETGTGSDWAAPMDLHTALADTGCTEIWVAAGVYKPVEPDDPDNVTPAEREISFAIDRQVEIYGGFNGTETERDKRDPAANLTILSGDIDNNDTTNNDGITEHYDHVIGDNSYHVVYIDGSVAAITDSTVIDGFIITGGHAAGDFPHDAGGGLFCDGISGECAPMLSNITFIGNRARFVGGAMLNVNDSGNGLTLNRVTFTGNFADDAGGAMFNTSFAGSNLALTNVTFSGNRAGIEGGAMFNDSIADTAPLAHVTFSGNSAGKKGGAMFNTAFGPRDPQSTHAPRRSWYVPRGGDTGFVGPALTHVILWGNSAPEGPEVYNENATPSIDHSIVQGGCPDGSTCGFIIDDDPRLGPLQDNGGFTQTLLPDIEGTAIDAGDDDACPDYDQRGVSRPMGDGCDIGAVELTQATMRVEVSGAGTVDAGTSPQAIAGGISECDEAGAGQAHCTARYAEGANENLVLALAPAEHEHISMAEGCGGTLDGDTFGIDALNTDCSVTVVFGLDQYTLTYFADPNGRIEGEALQTVEHGADGSAVTAVADDGYHFVQWDDGETANPRTDTHITADLSVTAGFAINEYTVTAIALGEATATPNQQTVPHGASAALSVTAGGDDTLEISGDCPPGTLDGEHYTTGPISFDCEVIVEARVDEIPVAPEPVAVPVLTHPAQAAALAFLVFLLGIAFIGRHPST